MKSHFSNYGIFNYSAYNITSGIRWGINTPGKYTTQWEGTFYRVTEQTECGSECFAKKVRNIGLFAN